MIVQATGDVSFATGEISLDASVGTSEIGFSGFLMKPNQFYYYFLIITISDSDIRLSSNQSARILFISSSENSLSLSAAKKRGKNFNSHNDSDAPSFCLERKRVVQAGGVLPSLTSTFEQKVEAASSKSKQ